MLGKANSEAANINPAVLGAVNIQSSSFNLLQVGFNSHSNVLNRSETLDMMFSQDSLQNETKNNILENVVQDNGSLNFNGNLELNWVSASWTRPGFGGLSVSLTDRISGHTSLQQNFVDVVMLGNEENNYFQELSNNINDETGNNNNPNNDPIWEDGSGNGQQQEQEQDPGQNQDPNQGQQEQQQQQAEVIYEDDYATGEADEVNFNSDMSYTHIRELSISYGRQAYADDDFKVHIGMNYRMIWGIGHFDSRVDEETGLGSGNSSFSDFYDINYNDTDSLFSNTRKSLFKSAGQGSSLSFGLNASYKDKWFGGLALLNMGRITWNENALTANQNQVAINDSIDAGLSSYQLAQETAYVYDMLGFEQTEAFETRNAGVMRINAAYKATQSLKLYTDIVIPLGSDNDVNNYQQPNYMLGFDYAIMPDAVSFSSAFHYNNEYGWRIPFGLSVALGESAFITITTGDLRTILNKEVEPYAALSISLIGGSNNKQN